MNSHPDFKKNVNRSYGSFRLTKTDADWITVPRRVQFVSMVNSTFMVKNETIHIHCNLREVGVGLDKCE